MRKFAAALLMCAMLAALSACGEERRYHGPDFRPSAHPLAGLQEGQTQAKQTEGLTVPVASTGPLAGLQEEQTQAKQTEGLAAPMASTGTSETTSGDGGGVCCSGAQHIRSSQADLAEPGAAQWL